MVLSSSRRVLTSRRSLLGGVHFPVPIAPRREGPISRRGAIGTGKSAPPRRALLVVKTLLDDESTISSRLRRKVLLGLVAQPVCGKPDQIAGPNTQHLAARLGNNR
jgi:hypothetical protein